MPSSTNPVGPLPSADEQADIEMRKHGAIKTAEDAIRTVDCMHLDRNDARVAEATAIGVVAALDAIDRRK